MVECSGGKHFACTCPLHGQCIVKYDVVCDGYATCARCNDHEPMEQVEQQLRPMPLPRVAKREGLGDLVGEFLATLGVTPESYVAAKEKVGLAPSCNCEARKVWLNKLGESVGVGEIADRLTGWIKTRQSVKD